MKKLSDMSITEMLASAEDGMNLFIEEISPATAQDEWAESKHKRDAEGKFTSGGAAKSEEKTEKQDIFTPSAELAERFKKEVQAVLADDSISKNHLLNMGTIPPLYIKLGLPDSKLNINKMTILKALGKAGRHAHDVPQEVLENLPALISDPEGVFKSSMESTNPKGFVAVLNAVNKDGKQILAAISPNEKGESGFNFIPSVYDKKNFENFVNKTNNENGIIYIKEKGSDLWGPLQSRPLHSQSLINKILTKEDFVKDLGSTKTNGTDGISAAPEDKESIKMDKRKVIEEIMAIAAKPADKFKDGKEEQIKTIAGLAEKLAYNKSERGANDEDAAKDKAKDENTPSNTDKEADKKAKEACDKADKAEDAMEARIAANFAVQYAKKAALYDRISPFTGSFDHLPMTLSQMAKYACDKLGIKGVAEDGAQTALEGYLVGAQKQAVVRQVKGASMDAAPESDAAFENYLKEAE